jgi:hypothetical protein
VKYTQDDYSVKDLVEQFQKNALLVNQDYQRGAVWTERQQGKFLDSLFRGYPVPAVFLRAIEHEGLRGTQSTFELIDGQQRLRALADFLQDKLKIPGLKGQDRLRLPAKVAAMPADWAGKTWSELSATLQSQLRDTKLRVFVVEHPTGDDEVRDLFIRLQAGTALTRQQIRDAWPGPISPFVESIGGKGRHPTKAPLLAMVDKRGDRIAGDDAKDPWVAHRQTCAQLLAVFLARERDPYASARIVADDLDELYHEVSEFDCAGPVAKRFRDALETAHRVFQLAAANHPGRKTKWRKSHIFAVFMVVQDLQRSPAVPTNNQNLGILADVTFEADQQQQGGRFTGPGVSRAGEDLRDRFFKRAGRLDENRQFSKEQQTELREIAKGVCQICGKVVDDPDAEFDHFPIPWAMCGPTTVENGRLVHKVCHPRGRPKA